MAEESVKVAVRVRPFNKRERGRGAKCIVEMKGATTYISDPDEPNEDPRSFTFDHSYWSHDGSKEGPNGYWGSDSGHKNGKIFTDQKRVFDDLGVGILNNAWEGYNSTLFAYGQTGSGKSWSVVGYGINKGIVPQYCETMFKAIEEKQKGGDAIEFEVTFSMLEIYMEEVRDLLSSKKQKGGLRVRQHPKKGFYAAGLTQDPVSSYKGIEDKMEQGTNARTVASTEMNATSSRAHTIVGITFLQKFKNAAGQETAKAAQVNLVDLAGSERAENTGATGDRLKEGAAINTSLSSLGNCIAALADRAGGKNVRVPFRDSVLTMLLKNALGGNSKTIMIAAISPADINYAESLSTLRYADRAKQIKTKVTVNEDPTEKLIRELQEENDKLKSMLSGGKIELPKGTGEDGIEEEDGMSESDKADLRKQLEEEYKAELEENDREMEEMQKTFEEKLKAAQEAGGDGAAQISATHEKQKSTAHMYNLNFDSQLSGRIIHFVEGEKKTVGNRKGETSDIILVGPSMQQEHAVFHVEGGKFYLEKTNGTAKVLINGDPCMQKTEIHHFDRLMFGTTQLFVFCNPKERDSSKEKFETPTYDMAQEEIAEASGIDMKTDNKSPDQMLLQEDMADILPAVEEANSISEDLDMKKKFEVVLVSPEARGVAKGRKDIFVRVLDLETDLEWLWPREKFYNRKFKMQEMYQKSEDDEDWKLPADQDPFVEDPNAETLIGSVKVWLQSLAYMVEMKEQLEVVDYLGEDAGLINIELVPCDKKGKEYTDKDDMFVDDPNTLAGKDVHFMVKLGGARGLPKRFTEISAKYQIMEEEFVCTKPVKDTNNPDWNFKKQQSFAPANEQTVKYLQEGAFFVQIWGKQKQPKTKKNVNTKDTLQKQQAAKGQFSAIGNTGQKIVDPTKVKYAMELVTARKRAEKAEAKVNQFKALIMKAEAEQKPRISTKLLKQLLAAPTNDEAQKCIKMVSKEKGAGN